MSELIALRTIHSSHCVVEREKEGKKKKIAKKREKWKNSGGQD
jgi:hypothetical protein